MLNVLVLDSCQSALLCSYSGPSRAKSSDPPYLCVLIPSQQTSVARVALTYTYMHGRSKDVTHRNSVSRSRSPPRDHALDIVRTGNLELVVSTSKYPHFALTSNLFTSFPNSSVHPRFGFVSRSRLFPTFPLVLILISWFAITFPLFGSGSSGEIGLDLCLCARYRGSQRGGRFAESEGLGEMAQVQRFRVEESFFLRWVGRVCADIG